MGGRRVMKKRSLLRKNQLGIKWNEEGGERYGGREREREK